VETSGVTIPRTRDLRLEYLGNFSGRKKIPNLRPGLDSFLFNLLNVFKRFFSVLAVHFCSFSVFFSVSSRFKVVFSEILDSRAGTRVDSFRKGHKIWTKKFS
jgi:hypothetical protein